MSLTATFTRIARLFQNASEQAGIGVTAVRAAVAMGESGGSASLIDLCADLDVTRPPVSQALGQLFDRGFVQGERSGRGWESGAEVSLTEHGWALVELAVGERQEIETLEMVG
jgi:DNA-binding MarR family transcriptional regulator